MSNQCKTISDGEVMSQHTTEPWHYSDCIISTEDQLGTDEYVAKAETIADARRIVVCVNACKGISTETLERVDLPLNAIAMMNRMAELARERDQAQRESAKANEELRAYKEAAESQKPVGYARPHQLEALLSGKVCGITMEDKPDAHSRVTVPLYANPVPDDKPAVAVPDGFGLIPMRNGKPDITDRMKVDCIGEFSWQEEAPYYDENGELHDYVATHVVPWDLCKAIYKRMASVAMLEATPSHSQQSAECRCHKCGAETPPPEPFKAYVKCACGTLTAATAALADDRCPSHESEQGGAQ